MYFIPLEVVGLMNNLLLFVIDSPPGPVQLIFTRFNDTPLIVVTTHLISCGLPTIAPCNVPVGIIVTVGVGTVLQVLPVHPPAHLQVLGAMQVPPLRQAEHIGEQLGGFPL